MSRSTRKVFSLPNGKQTKSPKVYIREWRKFSKPVAKALDSQLCGFDPGIHLYCRETKQSTMLSTWQVEKINKALEEAYSKGSDDRATGIKRATCWY